MTPFAECSYRIDPQPPEGRPAMDREPVSPLGEWWRANLSDPLAAEELIGRVNLHNLSVSARHYGVEILHRFVILAFTLLTLFFLFRDADVLTERLRGLGDRLIGVQGERIAA